MADGQGQSEADRLALAEYQLTERVEQRILGHAKVLSLVLVAGLTLFGLLGTPALLNYVSGQVTQKLSDQVSADTKRLRDRLDSDLTEIVVAKSDLESKMRAANAELAQLQEGTRSLSAILDRYKAEEQRVNRSSTELENLRNRQDARMGQIEKDFELKYDDLTARVDRLGRGVGTATDLAERSGLATQSLQGALVSSSGGFPAVFSTPSRLEDGNITGINFGESRGHVYLRVRLTLYHAPKLEALSPSSLGQSLALSDQVSASVTTASDSVLLTEDSIQQWSNSSISLRLSGSARRGVADAVEHARQSHGFSSTDLSTEQYEYQVETTGGQKSFWAYQFGIVLQ